MTVYSCRFNKYSCIGSFRKGIEILESDSMIPMNMMLEVNFYYLSNFVTHDSKTFLIYLVKKIK